MMNKIILEKIIKVCNAKIEKKGQNVGLSFYAFFANKNDNPELLMEVVQWWIMKHKLDHFEKAIKIRELIIDESNCSTLFQHHLSNAKG
jgi:hypothetical protein